MSDNKCILINKKEFQAMLSESGLPSYKLDLKIKNWMDENNTDKTPTLEQLGLKKSSGTNVKALDQIENNPNATLTIQDITSEALDRMHNSIELRIEDEKGKEVHDYKKIDDGKIIGNTFSQVAGEIVSKKFKTNKTDEQSAKSKMAMLIGTTIHSWFEEAIKSVISGIDSKNIQPGHETYYGDILGKTKLFMNSLIEKDKEAGLGIPKFFSEIRVYDENFIWEDFEGKKHKGIAGTIDLLVIHSDGSASIYDFKTTKSGFINDASIEKYGTQINLIKKVLEKGNPKFGLPAITKFRKTRIIPIEVKYQPDGRLLSHPKILEDIPVAREKTGIKELDNYINKISFKLESLLKSKDNSNQSINIERKKLINRLRNIIITLQRKKAFSEVLYDIESQLDSLSLSLSGDIKNMSINELIFHKRNMDVYSDLSQFEYPGMEQELKDKYIRLSGFASSLDAQLNKRFVELAEEQIREQGLNPDVISSQIKMGSMFKDLSQYEDPHLAAFYRLLQARKDKLKLDTDKFRKDLEKYLNALKKDSSKYGGMDAAFNMLIKESNGTLKLVSKFGQKYYDALNTAREKGNAEWLKKNISVNTEKLDAEVAFRLASIIEKPGSQEHTNAVGRIAGFKAKQMDLMTTYSRYIIVNPDVEQNWYTDEYIKINAKGNESLKNFYEFYKKSMQEFKEFLPDVGMKESFMAQMRAGAVEQFAKMNNSSLAYTKEYFRDLVNYRANEDVTMGMFDGNERLFEVPVFYTNSMDATKTSRDLGNSLQLFAEMAFNYKEMKEMEPTALILLESLKQREAYETGWTGSLKKVGGELVKSKEANKELVEALKDYIHFYNYGIETKQTGPQVKIISTLSNLSAKQAIGLNPTTAAVSLIANTIGQFEEVVKSKHYNASQLRETTQKIASNNKEEWAFLQLVHANPDDRAMMKNNKLSKHWTVRNANADHLFFMLRKADEFLFASTCGAMGRNYTVTENGSIVSYNNLRIRMRPEGFFKLSDAEKSKIDAGISEKLKSRPSLRDSVVMKDDNMTFKGNIPTEASLVGFKNAVREVVRNISGSLDNENTNRARMSCYWRAALLFRNWMPRAFNKRYGALQHNLALDEYEIGRYRSFMGKMFTSIVDEHGETKLALFMGVEKYAFLKYEEMRLNGETKGITENEFIEMTKQNVRASVYALAMTALMIAGLMALGSMAGDDDDKDEKQKFVDKFISRNVSEMMMWVNPQEAMKILKSPTAIIGPVNNILNLFEALAKESYGQLIGDDKMIENAKVLYQIGKQTPASAVLRLTYDGNKVVKSYLDDKE